MSRVCQITGKKAMVGHNVSFSNKKNKRRFEINLIKKKFYLPEEDAWVVLRVSTNGLRTINKKGIGPALKEAREKGFI
jgi:large subunit ribosomal protein L28